MKLPIQTTAKPPSSLADWLSQPHYCKSCGARLQTEPEYQAAFLFLRCLLCGRKNVLRLHPPSILGFLPNGRN